MLTSARKNWTLVRRELKCASTNWAVTGANSSVPTLRAQSVAASVISWKMTNSASMPLSVLRATFTTTASKSASVRSYKLFSKY